MKLGWGQGEHSIQSIVLPYLVPPPCLSAQVLSWWWEMKLGEEVEVIPTGPLNNSQNTSFIYCSKKTAKKVLREVQRWIYHEAYDAYVLGPLTCISSF